VTFPQSEAQEPTAGDPSAYPGVGLDETYKEGVFVGYRWFDAHALAPAFPFGFGLSYTQFKFGNLDIHQAGGSVLIGVTVTNVGPRDGAAVAQLYVGLPSLPGVPQPPAQLKGFAKVTLAPGQTAPVSFQLDSRSLSYWNVQGGDWQVAPGCYRVMVGSSSQDTPLRATLAEGGAGC
jgi:beta-glucosidase